MRMEETHGKYLVTRIRYYVFVTQASLLNNAGETSEQDIPSAKPSNRVQLFSLFCSIVLIVMLYTPLPRSLIVHPMATLDNMYSYGRCQVVK